MVLELDTIVFSRDEKGELIPEEVELLEKVNEKKETVFVTPLTRGERKKLVMNLDDKGDTSKDTDRDIVLLHCHKPKFDEKNIDDTPWGILENIALTILKASGMPVGKQTNVKKANKKIENDFQDA